MDELEEPADSSSDSDGDGRSSNSSRSDNDDNIDDNDSGNDSNNRGSPRQRRRRRRRSSSGNNNNNNDNKDNNESSTGEDRIQDDNKDDEQQQSVTNGATTTTTTTVPIVAPEEDTTVRSETKDASSSSPMTTGARDRSASRKSHTSTPSPLAIGWGTTAAAAAAAATNTATESETPEETLRKLTRILEDMMASINQLREQCEMIDRQDLSSNTEKKELKKRILHLRMTIETLKYGNLSVLKADMEKGLLNATVSEVIQTAFSDVQVYDIESELFDLQMHRQSYLSHDEKGKYGFNRGEFESLPVIEDAHRAMDAHKNMSKNKHWNSTGNEFVRKLLLDRNSFESKQIRHFIAKFNEQAEAQLHFRNMAMLERRASSKSSKRSSVAVHSSKVVYQAMPTLFKLTDFIATLADRIIENYNLDDSVEEEDVEIELEDFIVRDIYLNAYKLVEAPAEDELLDKRCKRFAHLTQGDMKVPEHLRSEEPIPFIDAVKKLRSINFDLTPTAKLRGILQGANLVYTVLQMYHPSITIGGDEFMDIWLYVVLQANIRNLASIIRFIKEYALPELLQGELGYYFSTLELATEYLKELTMDHIQPKNTFGDLLLTCERKKFRLAAQQKGFVKVVDGAVTLRGFRLYVVEEWAMQSASNRSAVVVRTNDETDFVVVASLQAESSTMTPLQTSMLRRTFLEPNSAGLVVEKLPEGVIVLSELASFQSQKLILVPNGDLDACLDAIVTCCSLKRMSLSCATDTEITAQLMDELNAKYKVGATTTDEVREKVGKLIGEVQVLLQLMGFMPFHPPANSMFTDTMLQSLIKYQKHHNGVESPSTTSQHSTSNASSSSLLLQLLEPVDSPSPLWPTLPEDGHLTPATLKELRNEFYSLKTSLWDAGLKFPKDPVQYPSEFSEVIQGFQRDQGLLTLSGCFDNETTACLTDLANARTVTNLKSAS